jgi:Tfp pilus assembly protein PilF
VRRILAVLGGLVLLADAGPAWGQVWFGPAGYGGWGPRGGVGFAFSGRRFVVSGFVGGGSGVIAPGWGPALGPWGYFGGPVNVVGTQPVVVVGHATPAPQFGRGFGGGFGRFDRPTEWEPEPVPPPAHDPLAAARVDEAVRRGDLLVIRPNGGGVPALPRPADPPPGFARQPGGFAPDPATVPKDPRQRAVFEVNRAREAFPVGEYGRAAERLADAIAASPDDPLAYFLLAQARTARGDYAGAVAAIRDGMRRAPDWPAATFNLKELYGPNAAAFDEHLAGLRKAAAADPNDPTLSFLLGYHLWFLGERAEAVKLFRRAANRVKDNEIIERFLLEAEGKKA